MPRMLNREICKVCVNRHGSESWPVYKWDRMHDAHWRDGVAVCPWIDRRVYGDSDGVWGPGGPGTAAVYSEPPEWCPYAMEHIVSQGDWGMPRWYRERQRTRMAEIVGVLTRKVCSFCLKRDGKRWGDHINPSMAEYGRVETTHEGHWAMGLAPCSRWRRWVEINGRQVCATPDCATDPEWCPYAAEHYVSIEVVKTDSAVDMQPEDERC